MSQHEKHVSVSFNKKTGIIDSGPMPIFRVAISVNQSVKTEVAIFWKSL